MRRLPSLHRLPLAFLLCCAAALLPADAFADEAMPSVVGESERAAVRTLEALGLDVRIITVAEAAPGRVVSQEPEEGAAVAEGDEAVLRVGVLVDVTTRVPRVIGMPESRAIDALSELYELEIRYVEGPAHLQARVGGQEPRHGLELAYRGRLRLDVIRNTVRVPAVIGMTEADAERALDEAGLGMHVRYVRSPFGRDGVVLGQNPHPGSRLEVGAALEVQVSGSGEADRPERVRVPHLEGLSMYDAEDLLHARGLVPHVHLVPARSSVTPLTVVGQEVKAGRRVAQGTHVGIEVAGGGRPGRVRLPALHGQSLDDVRPLLEHLGLRAVLKRTASNEAPGTILVQSPRAGTFLEPGQTIELRVAVKPNAGWVTPVVAVPDVRGASAAHARLLLLEAGLKPVLRQGLGADQPLDRVYEQAPAGGTRARRGTPVVYRVPLRASVPDIRGMTRQQALVALQQAGLQGLARRSGPLLASGVTQVYAQSVVPGRVIARGSLVEFRFRFLPPQQTHVRVPNVVGMSREDAVAKLRDAGLDPYVIAVSAGNGPTRIINQSPRAGASVAPRTRVSATYVHQAVGIPTLAAVPRVVGMELGAARRRLEGLGFRVAATRNGPRLGGAAKVIAQNPLGGTNRPRGSTVTLTYRHAAPAGQVVVVPNVVGMRIDKAISRLRSAGLGMGVKGFGKRVRSQSPAAGSTVAPGSQVKLTLK